MRLSKNYETLLCVLMRESETDDTYTSAPLKHRCTGTLR